jgi:hypothetical protein
MPKTNNQACLNLFGLGISFFKAELCWERRSQSLMIKTLLYLLEFVLFGFLFSKRPFVGKDKVNSL